MILVILTVTKLGQDVAPSFRLHGVDHTEVVEGIGGYMSGIYLSNIVRILKADRSITLVGSYGSQREAGKICLFLSYQARKITLRINWR